MWKSDASGSRIAIKNVIFWNYTEYWNIIIFVYFVFVPLSQKHCFVLLRVLITIHDNSDVLELKCEMWSSRTHFDPLGIVYVNRLTIPCFHKGYSGCKERNMWVRWTNKTIPINSAQGTPVAVIRRTCRAFKVWCPQAGIHIVMETNLASQVNGCAMDSNKTGKKYEVNLLSLQL